MPIFLLLCAAAVLAILVADAGGRPRWAGAAKVAASCAFVGFALSRGVADAPGGGVVLLALALCWLGDVLLIGSGRAAFLGGLSAFLLGHVAFGVAFLDKGVAAPGILAGAVVFGVLVGGALRWLGPHVEGAMVWPVRAYVGVIAAMGALAAGATAATGDVRLLAGAFIFAVSDLFVAREQFVMKTLWNRRVGLPLYYGSVLLLAASLP